MKGIGVSLPKQSNETINTPGIFLNEPPPPTSIKHSGYQEIPETQGIPGNSNNLSAAQNDIGSHEYMEAETQDLNGASDSPNEHSSPSSPSSPSLFGGNPIGTRSWSVPPRFTVTPVLNDQFNKDQLKTTPKDFNHIHGPLQ